MGVFFMVAAVVVLAVTTLIGFDVFSAEHPLGRGGAARLRGGCETDQAVSDYTDEEPQPEDPEGDDTDESEDVGVVPDGNL